MTTFSPSIVLAGFESAGKTALFRRLTGEATGHEANFRGSTVSCRSCHSEDCQCEIIDTPGVRLKADTETTRLALEKIHGSDTVLLVVRGTNLQQEMEGLLGEINASTKRLAVAVTFADKDEKKISVLAAHYRETLGVPVVALNARDLSPVKRTALLAAIQDARLPITTSPAAPNSSWKLVPSATWFEHRGGGPLLSLLMLALLWIVPVIAAFRLADFLQPLADDAFISPVTDWLNARLSPLAAALLTGGYGVLTLGWYSFLWAFPVVLFIGLSTGFLGSLARIIHHFELKNGHPVFSEEADESTTTPGLFYCGPLLEHRGAKFCFIYKFRSRFGVVASEIARRLGGDPMPLDAYEDNGFLNEDLDCCTDCTCAITSEAAPPDARARRYAEAMKSIS